MNKVNKGIVVFVIVLVLVLLWLFITGMPVNTSMQVDARTQANTSMKSDMETPVDSKASVQEARVSGLFVEFEEGTTEQEVKTTLENTNLHVNYSVENYNSDFLPSRYYITLDKNKLTDIEDLIDEINLTIPIKKGNNYTLTVTERAIQDKTFPGLLEKNNIQVKKSVYCFMHFKDAYTDWNPEEDIPKIEYKLKMNENILTVDQDNRITDLFVEFEDGTTESEVKAILENYNMTMNYSIDYNVDYFEDKYYISVDEDKIVDIRNELKREIDWTAPIFPDIKKVDHYIITVTEQATQDKNFLAMLEKNGLQVKKSVYCDILLRDEAKNAIWEIDALRIINELERNEKILTVSTGGST
ncbi:UPF0228 family protein [Methanosarcina siciliae]|nr:UPF0228 family protein [Methanosarcina siciliae]